MFELGCRFKHGVYAPGATLARWMIQLATLVQLLIHLLRERLSQYDYLGMDETRIQMAQEPDRSAES